MLKRTLFFAKPCRLSLKYGQIEVTVRETGDVKTIPVEDVGFVVLENQQISISMPLMAALVENNVAVIFCNKSYYPVAMLLNLNGHHLQQEHFSRQISAGIPLKKNLWKQTVEAKIGNQAQLLKRLGKDDKKLRWLARSVKSDDSDNREGTAARIYWLALLGNGFIRERYGEPPNNMLNYGYAVLRAAVARALAGSGLLATLGIHHHNRYNAFCLADDIMEPYRPFVDGLVYDLAQQGEEAHDLDTALKLKLVGVLTTDVLVAKQRRPLMVALSSTTSSLARCYNGETKKIIYPQWPG